MKTVSELVQREVMITNITLPPPCCSMAFPKTHHFHTTYDSPCLVALAAETDQTETSALTEEWWVWEGGGCHSMHKHERIGTISPNSSGERNHYNRPRQKKRSDGIDTVYVGAGSTFCAPVNSTVQSHCSVSSLAVLLPVLHYE